MILFTFYYLYFWGWKREGWRGREREDDIASSDEEGRLSFLVPSIRRQWVGDELQIVAA